MWPDQVSNPGPLTYESGVLPTALHGWAHRYQDLSKYRITHLTMPCPSHKNFNMELKHFVSGTVATKADSRGGAIALLVHSYT